MDASLKRIRLADDAAPISESGRKLLRELLRDHRLQELQAALGADAKLHLVGGCLRDALLGVPPVDLDLASAFEPDEIIARLAAAGIQTAPTGLKHQTVTAVFPGPVVNGSTEEGEEQSEPANSHIEITTFRGPDMSPAGGVVRSAAIEEDLRYRDFTINGLALELASETLIAPGTSLADLENRIVRAIGTAAERFAEDPLRALRFVRFCCLPGFTADELTRRSAQDFAGELANVAPERIREELNKILLSTRPVEGFNMLYDLGMLKAIMPELAICYGFEQNEFHPKDVFHHTMDVLEKTEADLVLRLAALLHDIGKPPSLSVDPDGSRHFYLHENIGAEMTEMILERLRYPHAVIQRVSTLVRTHMRPISAGPGGVRRLIRDTADDFDLWRKLKLADASSVRINREQLLSDLADFQKVVEKVKAGPDVSPLKNLAIGGRDLIELGLQPGPIFGRILRALHELVLDNPELNTRESLLRELHERNLVETLRDVAD